MDWIDLAQHRDKLQALVNTEMNIWFHKMWGVSLLAEELLVCQE
jgi:hypothetical protein